MFKNEEQIKVFTDHLESFIKATISYSKSTHVEDAVTLNKVRSALEAFMMAASGITTASDTINGMSCPDCGGEMALRTNRMNGQKFWGCKKFPNCKGTRDENGLSYEERQEQKYKKEQAVQEAGFSFNRDKRNVVSESSPDDWNPFNKHR